LGDTLPPPEAYATSVAYKNSGGAITAATKTATAVMVAMFVVSLSAGPALAALPLIVGTDAAERITGTKVAEEIRGLGGSDEITDGLGGPRLRR
jgi:hypothetical protein